MNHNFCSPNFQLENRTPLKDYTSNIDNIKQAKNRIAELQNIIHELNKSNGKQSISPIAKSPIKTHNQITEQYPGTSKKSPRFQTPELKQREMRIVSENVKMQTENNCEQGILNGVISESLMEKSLENYTLTKVLGLGSYAIVRLAQRGQMICAIKTYEKSKLNDQQKKKNVSREVKILSKLKHPNIIKLIGACETQIQLHVIMEYYSASSLNTYIKSKPLKRLEENEARHVFLQVVDAVRYCHHKSVVHRDLKLENILIDPITVKIKIIDFGFSIAIDPSSRLNIFCGTPSYMAPEIVNKATYSFPADVWALGILLYKMTTGNFPFKGNDDKDLYKQINTGKLEFPQSMSLPLKSIIKRILNVNQNERPTLKELSIDEWLL